MDRPLSLTPSISQILDRIRIRSDQAIGATPEASPLVRWRGATDMLGLAVFVLMLGSYLAVHL